MSATLILKPGREKSLLRLHPWVFSGAIDRLKGHCEPGSTLAVHAADGRFLAWAAWNPATPIRAKVWSFTEQQRPDAAWFAARVAAAVARRQGLAIDSDGLRLVHAEADGLPGLIADRYGDTLVVQLSSAGAEHERAVLIDALQRTTGCSRVHERSDADARELEGLAPRSGPLAGSAVADPLIIREAGLRYQVDIVAGQKTGFYLDQRDNRALVGGLARGSAVLNCFCYTGGFSLPALAAGAAAVLSVDSSGPALQAARANVVLNGLDESRCEWAEADVFKHLRQLRREGRQFDLIVLDPPKFAPTSRDAERAARGYKDINLNALHLLRPGGWLATFSCSSGISVDLFQKIVAGAAADARAECLLERRLAAAPDHPVSMAFPEGEYLKGLLLRRL